MQRSATTHEAQRAARWRDLRLNYLSDARQSVATVLAIVRPANGATLRDAERRTVRLLAHRLRGSSGFFGFAAIGAGAAALEDAASSDAQAADLEIAAASLEQQVLAAAGALES